MAEKSKKGTRIHVLLFSLLTSICVFSYLLSRISFDDVLEAIKNISVSWLVLFLLFSVSMSVFRTWRYQLILHASGVHAASVPLFLITIVRNFFSDLLPARLGTLVYIYLVKSRLGLPLGPVVSSFAHAFVFDIISLSLLILPAVATVAAGEMSRPVLIISGLALTLASILVLVSLPWFCRVGSMFVDKLKILPASFREKLVQMLIDSAGHLLKARQQGIYLRLLMLSFAVRVCKYGSLYALLLGLVLPFGYMIADFPVNKVFLGLCSAELAASLPISGIAGFGAYEGAWALVFQLLGYPEQIAVVSSIAHHLLTQVYGYGLGGIALLLLLLPFFNNGGSEEIAGTKIEERWFWMKYLVSVLVVVVSAVMLMAFVVDSSVGETRSKQLIRSGVESSTGKKMRIPPGRLVYERPDGIYLYDTVKRKEKRIAREGRNPRFSPDGEFVAFINDNSIMVVTDGGNRLREIARSEQPRTLCFAPNGTILFSDGKAIKRVNPKTLEVENILRDGVIRELAINQEGDRLAVTVKSATGLRVKAIDLKSGEIRTVSRGCSATISPDGRYITVNARDHRKLYVFDWKSLEKQFSIPAPGGGKFDNHYWSSSNHWLVSTAEGDRQDIYIHHVPSGWSDRITDTGDSDRADFFVVR
ncbi:lysylphosphatidylglycerol synthase domain-containing protein [Desulfopila sp. IMCC35008]|uniref:lysylphosphatidylglycerol synthase domain-containing protein n=1 Tax=Desulfopila sp. IMCC35008 TaxID=2653858 RepID=UPI0013D3275F|nr:lysylphosphatidylglycerol synthase domain-containing protein [Desulfopila sp. IMCC35008]